jgi:F0F1-type ATP synthase epsilon subunit
VGERAEVIDVQRAETAAARAQERMKAVREEQGFEEAHQAYVRAVTRLAVARHKR